MFLGRRVFEKNVMLTRKKFNVAQLSLKTTLTFEILQCYIFVNHLIVKNIFINYIEKRIFRPNFMFLGRRVLKKNAMLTCKNSVLHNCPNKQL